MEIRKHSTIYTEIGDRKGSSFADKDNSTTKLILTVLSQN